MVHFSSIAELSGQLRERSISSVELVGAHLERIQRLDETLGAFITVRAEEALAEARAADQALARGDCQSLPCSVFRSR